MDERSRDPWRLRQQLHASRRAGRDGYGRDAKALAVRYAQGRQSEGVGLRAIADECGVAAATVRRWLAEPADTSAFMPIRVMPSAVTSTVVVHGPAGLRIEGLDLEQIAELWRRLA